MRTSDHRTQVRKLYLSKAEHALIRRAARALNMAPSTWCRDVVLDAARQFELLPAATPSADATGASE